MKESLVSIVIPAYNSGDRIEKCIDSILKNNYKNLEIIIVDDGSDEENKKIYKSILEKCNKIIILDKENGGVSSARNFGLDYANGEYIIFVDSDDMIDSSMIYKLVESSEKSKSDLVVCGHGISIESNLNMFHCKKRKQRLCHGDIMKSFFTTYDIGWNVWGKLFKRNIVENVRFVEGKKTAEDMFFIYETLKNVKVLTIIDDVLYYYDNHQGSAMTSSNCENFFDTYDLVEKVYFDDFYDKNLSQEKLNFYIKSELWFFKFITFKDSTNTFSNEIKKKKQKFLANIDGKVNTNSPKTKLELFLFKNFHSIFQLEALIWGRKRKIL
ncbi:glycosyltransferase family 2 protein [Streptococcus thermophilus]|uniref:glycosyltransferase family 2 protein n=1 Tax=Streptococcus thermophilus TaxID=1308 RepID=UPI0019CF5CA9|nr:glycosyltransferase family 2 protein [Streptococcus thermophilus]MBN6047598.1 glycosyltransferase family 2 protein [Streptococcus thermophilus]